jgi:vitamin B12/bleomycin/antimicrobial peptide transport system ATP-binding/permease protein
MMRAAQLNNLLLDRWLKNGRYYQLNLVGGAPKNPECRIADDIRIDTEAPIEFATGATTAVLSAATFSGVVDDRRGAYRPYRGNSPHHPRHAASNC